MENALVSIIIPTYNRVDLIGETLKSIIAQTYQHWECIIIDDGSIDGSLELIKSFLKTDSRFKLYCRPHNRRKGASSCRNIGLEKATGKYIQFLDSDDLLMKNKLEEQLKVSKGDDLILLTCKWGGFENSTDLENRFKSKYHSYRNFRKPVNLLKTFGKKDEFFPPHVYLTPRKLIDRAGSWDEELTNNDDAEFFTRIILSAKKIKFTPKTAVYYRYSGLDKLSRLINEERAKSAVNSWKLIEAHIKQVHQGSALLYVKNAKRFLENSLKKDFPGVIEDEIIFFKGKD